MRVIRSTSGLFSNFVSLFLSYAIVITLFAPFAISRAQAAPSAAPVSATLVARPVRDKGGRREAELLVRFRKDVTEQDRTALVESRGGRRGRKLRGESRLEKVELQAGQDPQALAGELRLNPAVELAEPNFLISRDEVTPNDTRFAEQWALRNTGSSGGQVGADISALPSWQITTGSTNTIIGVVDSGIDFTHPDLIHNQWTNSGERDNGRDDDRNGFVDDLHGWDWVAASNMIKDEQGHGTGVAGIIAAEGNNGAGTAGVMWRASLMSLRVLDNTGTGDVADAVEAIDYAVAHGAQVINCSWGTDEESLALRDAIEQAGRRGVVVVTSAGNGGRDLETAPYYPASFGLPNQVVVASTDQFDQLAPWSSRGALPVIVAAPGTDILTTQIGGGYRLVTGTSASAPLVSGVAGLVKTVRPWLSANGTAAAIRDGVRHVAGLEGQLSTGGVVSASGALAALQGPNNPPPGHAGNSGGDNGAGNNGDYNNGGGNGNGHPATRPPAPGYGSGGRGPGGSFSVEPPARTTGAPGPNLPNMDELRKRKPIDPKPQAPISSNFVRCPTYDASYPDCDGTYDPGGTDPDFATARGALENETGQPGVDLGSRNYNWALPIVGLKGRAGLDLGISLTYNSLVWTKQGSTIRFNADRGFPGPGFRLGFPTLQQRYYDSTSGLWAYMMITPSGGRVEMRQINGMTYESADSSYTELIDYGTYALVRTKDGTQLTFTPSVNGEMRCIRITDRNGNYITINYNSAGFPTSAVDTLERTVNFNYDANLSLTSITQTWNGQTRSWATFGYGDLYVQTNFPGLTRNGPNNSYISVLTQVSLTDGSRYGFSYTSWGQVYQITHYAPDGHQWEHTRYNLPLDASTAQADCPRFTERYDYAENWNNEAEAVTGYSVDPVGAWSQMTTPDGTVYKELFATSGWQKGLTTGTEVWAGSPLVKKKWTTTAWTQDETSVGYQLNPRPYDMSVYDEAGNRRHTDITYTSYGLPWEVREYSADGSGYGGFLRRTYTDYNLTQAYLDRHIIGLASAVHVVDAGNNLVSKTSYDYDWGGEYLSATAQPATRHLSNSSDPTGRGNLVGVRRWDVTDSTNVNLSVLSTTGYNSTGTVKFTRDALGHQISFSYADSFSDGINNRNTLAYPTTVTDADNYFSTAQYNYDFGAVTRTQDPLGAVQTTSYDGAGRIDRVTNQLSGAYKRWVYDPWGWTLSYETIESGQGEAYSFTGYDGAGRVRAVGGDNPGTMGTLWGQYNYYDVMGRVSQQSNREEIAYGWTLTGDDGATGWIWTTRSYDWKGRPLVTTNADGTTTENSYGGCGCAGGEVTTARDERGRRRRASKDVLGRVAKIEELNWDQSVYSTTGYTYNGRDQLTNINQAGQQRSFEYDGHGRLSARVTPEQGRTTYSYYADDMTQTITDARGATTTFGYTNRHQVSTITYGVPGGVAATPNVSIYYDSAGNRSVMVDGLGYADYQYNAMSQLISERRYFNELGVAYMTQYGYNLAGGLSSVTTPWNEQITYGHDRIGRVTDVTTSASVTPYASGLQYRAFGALKQMTYGNGRALSIDYDARMRIKSWDTSGVVGWEYRYDTPNIHENTNRVAYARNLYDGTLDRSYDYDQVGRMWASHSGAEARGHVGISAWGPADGPYAQNQGFDVYGNMVARNGWGTQNSAYAPASFVNNRMQANPVTGAAMQYDASGNLTGDGQETFSYDATGQQAYASGSNLYQYYDGDGLRAKKIENGVVTYYVRASMLGNQVEAEISGGTWKRVYVYLGSQMLAMQEGGQTRWVHQDPVTKSQRVTNTSGAVVSTIDLDPWGGETWRSSNQQLMSHRYTSYERDDNGGDEAQMRRYQSKWTRFSQPDPFDGSYDISDPQSFNRYSYVENDPVNRVDPSGLDGCTLTSNGYLCTVDVPYPTNEPLDSFFFGLYGLSGERGFRRPISEFEPRGRFTPRDSEPQNTDSKDKGHTGLSKEQCDALRELLKREEKFGTRKAASMSSISYGDQPLGALSNDFGNIRTHQGELDQDWLIDLRGITTDGGELVMPKYAALKTVWSIYNYLKGTPLQNGVPFRSPAERLAVETAMGGTHFSEIFDEEFMKKNCSN
jgi:RHS repeat-associated protein